MAFKFGFELGTMKINGEDAAVELRYKNEATGEVRFSRRPARISISADEIPLAIPLEKGYMRDFKADKRFSGWWIDVGASEKDEAGITPEEAIKELRRLLETEGRDMQRQRAKRKFSQVYQFYIVLLGIKPRIWRRIQVPATYSFWDLHVAITDSMGWLDYHLHEFEMVNPRTERKVLIGMPDDEYPDEREVFPDDKEKIARYFTLENRHAQYAYDFGDGWQHRIELEKIIPRHENIEYPRCLAGRRACPPEDCGGIGGYANLLEALADPDHEEHEQLLTWVGEEYDSEAFDPTEVNFWDPAVRRKLAFD